MKKINDIKQEKNLQTDELPVELQDEIKGLQKMIVKYNDACDTYEAADVEDEKTEKELDKLEDEIAEIEISIVEKIKAIPSKEVPPVDPIPDPAPAPAPAPAPEKKEDNSVGWLIFGGVALVATLGLVNVFKKK
jgi:hypothetical protein